MPSGGGQAKGKETAATGKRPYGRRNLENAALHYLGRYASSEARLREIMQRKLLRARERGREFDERDAAIWIEEIITRFRRLGYLDDDAYARMRARVLFGRGRGLRSIRFDLQQKGLSAEHIEAALAALREEYGDADLEAARRFCRRRRLGPWRRRPPRENDERRDLAALARNGFSYSIARRVLDEEGDEEIWPEK